MINLLLPPGKQWKWHRESTAVLQQQVIQEWDQSHYSFLRLTVAVKLQPKASCVIIKCLWVFLLILKSIIKLRKTRNNKTEGTSSFDDFRSSGAAPVVKFRNARVRTIEHTCTNFESQQQRIDGDTSLCWPTSIWWSHIHHRSTSKTVGAQDLQVHLVLCLQERILAFIICCSGKFYPWCCPACLYSLLTTWKAIQ